MPSRPITGTYSSCFGRWPAGHVEDRSSLGCLRWRTTLGTTRGSGRTPSTRICSSDWPLQASTGVFPRVCASGRGPVRRREQAQSAWVWLPHLAHGRALTAAPRRTSQQSAGIQSTLGLRGPTPAPSCDRLPCPRAPDNKLASCFKVVVPHMAPLPRSLRRAWLITLRSPLLIPARQRRRQLTSTHSRGRRLDISRTPCLIGFDAADSPATDARARLARALCSLVMHTRCNQLPGGGVPPTVPARATSTPEPQPRGSREGGRLAQPAAARCVDRPRADALLRVGLGPRARRAPPDRGEASSCQSPDGRDQIHRPPSRALPDDAQLYRRRTHWRAFITSPSEP